VKLPRGVDRVISLSKEWSDKSWVTEKVRSWKEYQKAKNTVLVNGLIKKIQSLKPGNNNIQKLRNMVEQLLPQQKFGSNMNQKN
jgi:hypothetical protein